MEETSPLHLLTQHPIILFIIGAVILIALVFLGAKLFARRSEDARRNK